MKWKKEHKEKKKKSWTRKKTNFEVVFSRISFISKLVFIGTVVKS